MFRSLFTYLGLGAIILSLILPSTLNYGLFKWQSKKVKQEVKALFKSGLQEDELTVFRLEADAYRNLDWEEAGEFIWAGHKYDVLSVEIESGAVILKAWLDDKESSLRQRFHHLLKQHQPQQNNNDLKLIDLFKGFFFQLLSPSKSIMIEISQNDRWSSFYQSIFRLLESPPPLL